MTSPREPLHQPPNPADLLRVPPETPRCAEIRGLLRDFADGDLEVAVVREVEEHVTGCRTCAIELARAEHELLRLRAVFGVLRREDARGGLGGVRPGFAARVVDRLVLDETSMVSAEAVDRAVAAADRERAGGEDVGDPTSADREQGDRELVAHRGRPRPGSGLTGGGVDARVGSKAWWRSSVAPAMALLSAVFVFCALLVVTLWSAEGAGPQPVARLVVLDAAQTFDVRGRRLGAGSGVGEQQSLRVGRGGEARIDWHDLSSGPQPAATLQVRGEGLVRMENGAPVLWNGRLEVDTNREVSLPLGDGSRVQFGVGEYVVVAELAGVQDVDPDRTDGSSLTSAPADLLVRVEVKSGQPASIVNVHGPALVARGQVGVYTTGSPVSVVSGGGVAVAGDGVPPTRETPGGLSTDAFVAGHVHERSGLPSAGSIVYYQFASSGAVQSGARVTGLDGGFLVNPDLPCTSDFAVVMAMPAELRRELGVLVPDAVQLVKNGSAAQFAAPLVLDLAAPLDGTVLDDLQQLRANVAVLPCVVDELFGGLFLLDAARSQTGVDGHFHLERLPANLPAHQSLVLLIVHPELDLAIVPVPARGGVLANAPLPTIQLQRLRTIRLEDLPHNANVEVFEIPDGGGTILPTGSCLRRRVVHTDSSGRVLSFQVGYGTLWVRLGSGQPAVVRKLGFENMSGGVPNFEPQGAWRSMASLFRPQQPIVGTDVGIASSYRHQRFQAAPLVAAAENATLLVRDSLNRPVAGAQVFAVDPAGTPEFADVRFLGFTNSIGSISLEPVRDDGDLFVIAADGSVAHRAEPQASVGHLDLNLNQVGRVLLHPSLRPTDGSHPVVARFERLDESLPGLNPIAIRFASEATGWEFGNLVPGTYRVQHHGELHELVVPSGGFVELD